MCALTWSGWTFIRSIERSVIASEWRLVFLLSSKASGPSFQRSSYFGLHHDSLQMYALPDVADQQFVKWDSGSCCSIDAHCMQLNHDCRDCLGLSSLWHVTEEFTCVCDHNCSARRCKSSSYSSPLSPCLSRTQLSLFRGFALN